MMAPVNFADMREVLRTISAAVGPGYLVSCAWDGQLMRVSVGRRSDDPAEWRKPWVTTFDSEADYSLDPAKIIDELAHGAKAWFGTPKDQSDEICRLLELVAAKT